MSDIDELVDKAVAVVSTLARRGSSLTTGVAVLAGLVFGAAYLVGLAAFGGTTRTVWAIVGGIGLLFAVGAPLLATFRLRAIPRKASSLAGELRTLVNRDSEARRVVIDTVEGQPESAQWTDVRGGISVGGLGSSGFGSGRFGGGSRTPPVVLQFQRFSSLRSLATSADVKNIASVAQTGGSLPGLVAGGIALTGIGAVLGFIFTLIWIF